MPDENTLSCSQLVYWCAAYNVNLTRDCEQVAATAYDISSHAISRCVVMRKVLTMPQQSDDLPHALDACDELASELLILKPSVAFKLNL